jgi:hypothetical protein
LFVLATRRAIMPRFLITSFLVLVFAVPALAKPRDVYPVPCNDLWTALKDTLGNQRNYGVFWEDDAGQKASFVVVGALAHYTQIVELRTRGGGCVANATILELGPDNRDWRQFQHRLARSLAKLQAAKPKSAAMATGHP